MVKAVTLFNKLYFFNKSLQSKKKKLALTLFCYVSREIWLAIQKSLFAQTNQDSTFSHTCKNSKMFNITSKYFDFLTISHLQTESCIK